MVASLLYYRKFTCNFKSKNFMMNPYDSCVWNKKVNGKQLMICFHVDDCKLLHDSLKVLDETIKWFCQDCESIFEDGSSAMKVMHGKLHKYFGIDLDFSTRGQVKISMFDYVKEIVTAWDKTQQRYPADGFAVLTCKSKGKASAMPDDLYKVDAD